MTFEELNRRDLLRRLWPFFAILGVFWVISAYWWGTMGYQGTFRWLNAYHLVPLDTAAMYVFTHFADGLVLPAVLFLFFWRRDPVLAVTAVIAVLATGLVTQFGKIVVFSDWHRPPVVFSDFPEVHILHGHPPRSRSFPSGHATSSASGGLFFALLFSYWRRWLPVLVGVFTLFVAYTRVIIGVHFPGDIFIGSIIGSVGSLLILLYIYPWLSARLGRLRRGKTGRVALIVGIVSVLIIVGQMIHLVLVT